MKNTLFAIMAALPLLAQDGAPQPPQGPPPAEGGCCKCACKCCAPHHARKDHEARKAAFMAKFDTNKDGKIDEQEREAIKAAHEARKAEFEKKLLEKFDTNKDGVLDEQEKAAAKAEFAKKRGCCGPRPHGPKHHGPRHHGPKGPGCCPPAPPCGDEPAPEAAPACCPPPAPPCGDKPAPEPAPETAPAEAA